MTASTKVTTEIVRSADGASAQVRLYRRVSDPSAPVLVCMPAMGTAAAYYTPLADSLLNAGIQVALGELRGQGTSSVRVQRGVRFGYHEIVAYDYPALFRLVQAAFPSARRYLLGHSLGGQLGALYLAQEPHVASGAILVGAPSCYFRCWPFPRSLGVLTGIHLAVTVASVYGYFPGDRFGILGDQPSQILRDLAAQVRTGLYQVPSSELDFETLLATLDLPILAVTINGDTLAPPDGVQRLCDKLKSACVVRWDLSLDYALPTNPHYHWIRNNTSFVNRARRFLSSHS